LYRDLKLENILLMKNGQEVTKVKIAGLFKNEQSSLPMLCGFVFYSFYTFLYFFGFCFVDYPFIWFNIVVGILYCDCLIGS
jgi:serine/threonine protein kinase